MLLLPGNDPAAIQAAAQRLADGELLGLPTETVYGLAARADRDEIDERTGRELVLRLHERRLRRELQGAGADLVRATELQARLTKVHSALAELV